MATRTDNTHKVSGKSDPETFSHTNNASTNALLILCIQIQSAVARSGAPTYNSVSMTQAGSTITNASGVAAEIWYLTAPATGTNTVSIPNAGKDWIAADAISYNGIDQTTPLAGNNGATGSSSAPSVSLSGSSGDLIVDAMVHEHMDVSTHNQGNLVNATDEGQWNNGAHEVLSGADPQTMSWTAGGSDIWAIKVAGFNNAAAPSTVIKDIIARGMIPFSR